MNVLVINNFCRCPPDKSLASRLRKLSSKPTSFKYFSAASFCNSFCCNVSGNARFLRTLPLIMVASCRVSPTLLLQVVEKSNEKVMSMTKEEYETVTKLSEEIF